MSAERATSVDRLLRGLAGSDYARRLAPVLLAGTPVQAAHVQLATERVARPERFRWQAVALSAMLLGRADLSGHEHTAALSALRHLAVRRAHRGREVATLRTLLWTVAPAAGLFYWGIDMLTGLSGPFPMQGAAGPAYLGPLGMLVTFLGALTVPLGVMVGRLLDDAVGMRLSAEAIDALGRLGDRASLVPIAEAYCEADDRLRLAGRAALLRVLPLLAPGPSGWMANDVMSALCEALAHAARSRGPDRFVALAVLDTLDRVGDGRAVDTVRLVSADRRDETVRARALEVLPVLEARLQHERDETLLLRPAAAPTDTLLRPAAPTAPAESETLLRPSQPD